MARVTHVKHARQRYEQKPANVDADGNAVKVGLTNKDGSPKMTSGRRGGARRQIFITPTVDDRTKPLPMPKCDKCGAQINPGDPYKHVTPKSGPYGGRTRNRCATCPSWQYWELSNSWSARIAQTVSEAENRLSAEVDGLTEQDDAESLRDEIAQSIRDLAEEKQEAADNLEEGFGHATSQSEEIADEASQLSDWADEIEGVDIDEIEIEDVDCDNCGGTGQVAAAPDDDERDEEGNVECGECNGTGEITPDEPTEEQLDEWRESVRGAISDALANQPF